MNILFAFLSPKIEINVKAHFLRLLQKLSTRFSHLKLKIRIFDYKIIKFIKSNIHLVFKKVARLIKDPFFEKLS
jgi:hypothetical protein